MKSHQPCKKAVPPSITPYCLLTGICCCYLTWLRNTLLLVTVFPVKPWTPEKISGMFIVSRTIRCEMKSQKITDKPQQGSPFFHEKSSIFPLYLSEKAIFLPQTNTSHQPNYGIDLKVSADCENLQRYGFASWVKVSQLQKNMDQKPPITANYHGFLNCMWNKHRGTLLVIGSFFSLP